MAQTRLWEGEHRDHWIEIEVIRTQGQFLGGIGYNGRPRQEYSITLDGSEISGLVLAGQEVEELGLIVQMTKAFIDGSVW